MNRDVLIRRGLPKDSQDFGRLLLLSARSILPAFGTNGNEILRSLFGYKCNLFSFEHSYFIEVNGRNAGMILSYDGKVEQRERLRTGQLLLKYMKLQLMSRLPILLKVNSVFGKVGVDEYYISNIAVYPEYRGFGLGTELLTQAEDEARRAGARSIVLDVETNSQEAIKLYLKSGYAMVEKPIRIAICGQDLTFSRMCKAIFNFPTTDTIIG